MERILKITPKQSEAIQALRSRKFKYFLFGGGMGGGKSYLTALVILSCANDQPKTRYGVFRKNMTVLKRTTYQTFIKAAETLGLQYKANRADMFWDIPHNGSRIYFMELDEAKDPDFNKAKGLELTAAAIDEANEIVEGAFNILMGRIGRENNNGEPAFILLTCNPSTNWVKTRFYDPYSEGKLEAPYFFLQALAKDNPFLTKDYLEILEDLPEAEYQRYVKGDWSYSDDPNQLIRYEWIKNNIVDYPGNIYTHIGIDVARMGNDRTIFAYRYNTTYASKEVFRQQDTITTGRIAIERMKEHSIGSDFVIVDSVGVGGGVIDHMKSQGYNVIALNSGESPQKVTGHLSFKNMRAQMYWEIREGLQQGNIKLVDDPDAIKELINIRYFIKDKTIQIESKEEIKKRLGYSPDIADAIALSFCSAPSEVSEARIFI